MKNSSTFTISWLHSWSGLLFGWLLFAVFLTGTLTVFNNEITAWMQPELQEVTWDAGDSHEAAFHLTEVAWRGDPEERVLPAGGATILQVKLQDRRTFSGQTIDPVTGELVTFRDTQGGDFFYHFHYGLLAGWPGAWMVGAAAIAMILTLVTGLGIHRRISTDVLAFRSWSLSHRAWVDIHNLTGMLVLPFHLMMTVTGLIIFWTIYMPVEAPFSASEQIISLVSLLHFVRFGGSTMRWLYFVMGLLASGVIATGLVLWTGKRRKYYAGRTLGIGVVEILNVAAMGGLLVAIAVFFWANRLLPTSLIDRSLWEIRCFFLAWCLCLVHSCFRTGSLFAWKDQLYGAAILLGCLPLLNGLTTKSHLLMTVPRGQWALAAVDLTALVAGTLLAATARRIGQAARTK